MNAIEIKIKIDAYMDATRNGRFFFSDYDNAVNDYINKFIVDQFGDSDERKKYGFETTQQIRDNLYSIIKSSALSPTTGAIVNTNYGSSIPEHILTPSDFFDFVSLQTLISGITTYVRPTTYNELIPLIEDSFKCPTNKQPYYVEDKNGYTIYRGTTGVLTSALMTYIKQPNTFTVGNENQLINAGIGVLTIGLDYIATDVSVIAGTTFQPGTQFTSVSVTLTSGQVILASNTVTCELPEKVHNDIAKGSAEIMSGIISDFNRSAFIEKESQ